jgi:4-hydroxy-tetrahydrodipicolinate synthase
MGKPLVIRGLYPAVSVPFDAEYRIIEDEFQGLIRTIDRAPGVGGVAVNGHAGELLALTEDERARIVRLARESLSADKTVICGIDDLTVDGATRKLKIAQDAGADAALVFPPFDNHARRGLARTSDAPYRYFSGIAAAGLPLVVFEYAMQTGIGYTTETLVRLAEIDEVVAVKDGVGDTQLYQEHVEALAGKVALLPSSKLDLLGLLLLGGQGALIGSGQIGPAFWGRFVAHVLGDEVREARDVFVRHLVPISTHIMPGRRDAVSSPHARSKEALVQLGIFSSSRMRPPEVGATEFDRRNIRLGLEKGQLIPEAVSA